MEPEITQGRTKNSFNFAWNDAQLEVQNKFILSFLPVFDKAQLLVFFLLIFLLVIHLCVGSVRLYIEVRGTAGKVVSQRLQFNWWCKLFYKLWIVDTL